MSRYTCITHDLFYIEIKYMHIHERTYYIFVLIKYNNSNTTVYGIQCDLLISLQHCFVYFINLTFVICIEFNSIV